MSEAWDPLKTLGRNDPCWCGSNLKYKACHGAGARSTPGEPLPPDEPGTIWLAPHTKVDPHLLLPEAGTPIYIPSGRPESKPIAVREIAARLAEISAREPTLALSDIGRMRFELLEGLGLGAAGTVGQRLATLTEDQVEALVYGTLDLAKATADRLLHQLGDEEAPTTVWIDSDHVLDAVGRTLLWADHYLTNDDLFSAHPEDRPAQERAITGLLGLRPLIEAGLVVPVPEELAIALAADLIHERTRRQLEVPGLLHWVESQLIVEGPTAREVMFIGARDDVSRDGPYFFMYGRAVPGSSDDKEMTLEISSLNRFDPKFDYTPWIHQEMSNVAERLVQEVQRQRTVADTFGGHLVTRAPFRARMLARSEHTSIPGSLIWADAPVLVEPDVRRLADAVAHVDAVEDLRRLTRRTFHIVTRGDLDDARAMSAATELVHDDWRQAVANLKREIDRDRRWQLVAPTGSTLAAFGLGILAQPDALLVGAVAGAMNLRSAVKHYRSTMQEHRRKAAYALVVAQRPSQSRRRRAP